MLATLWADVRGVLSHDTAIEKGNASGVSSRLLAQVLQKARDRGVITEAEHRRLTDDLEARS